MLNVCIQIENRLKTDLGDDLIIIPGFLVVVFFTLLWQFIVNVKKVKTWRSACVKSA